MTENRLTQLAGWHNGETMSLGVAIHDGDRSMPSTEDCLAHDWPHLHIGATVVRHVDYEARYNHINGHLCVQSIDLLEGVIAACENIAHLFGLEPMDPEALARADRWAASVIQGYIRLWEALGNG